MFKNKEEQRPKKWKLIGVILALLFPLGLFTFLATEVLKEARHDFDLHPPVVLSGPAEFHAEKGDALATIALCIYT